MPTLEGLPHHHLSVSSLERHEAARDSIRTITGLSEAEPPAHDAQTLQSSPVPLLRMPSGLQSGEINHQHAYPPSTRSVVKLRMSENSSLRVSDSHNAPNKDPTERQLTSTVLAIGDPIITTSADPAHRPSEEWVEKRRKLPSEAVTILKQWLFNNASNPYPTDSQKNELAIAAGIQYIQVSNWFVNARRRILVRPEVTVLDTIRSEEAAQDASQPRRRANRCRKKQKIQANGTPIVNPEASQSTSPSIANNMHKATGSYPHATLPSWRVTSILPKQIAFPPSPPSPIAAKTLLPRSRELSVTDPRRAKY